MPDMRFAPPAALRFASTDGLNAKRIRTHNDRLILSLLRMKGTLSRMEVVRITGLSPQTVSVIVRALQKDDLCIAGETIKGSVGPPSTPMSLNPDGAFSIGIHIGCRSMKAVLVDFHGHSRSERHCITDAPQTMDQIQEWVVECHHALRDEMEVPHRGRLVGIGIVFSNDVEPESTKVGQEEEASEFEKHLEQATGLDVFVQNATTAAASAEVIFGEPEKYEDFAYIFIGLTVEMRLVLNHRTYAGQGSQDGRSVSNLTDLEKTLSEQGHDSRMLLQPSEPWPAYQEVTDWTADISRQIADLAITACGIVGVRTLILEGDLPQDVLEQVVEQTEKALNSDADAAWQVRAGHVGRFAKAIGAASVPLYARFMDDGVGISAFLQR